jgi:hypothetical protein
MKLPLRIKPRVGSTQSRGKSALPSDWVDSLPNRAQPPRRLKGGHLVPIKGEPQSRKVRIVTGAHSKAIRGELDGRYSFSRVVTGYLSEYRPHVGPDRSVVLDDLCRSAAVHKTCANLSLVRLREAIARDDSDEAKAAYEVWRAADREHREVARLLGIPRREKAVRSLSEVLSGAEEVEEEPR